MRRCGAGQSFCWRQRMRQAQQAARALTQETAGRCYPARLPQAASSSAPPPLTASTSVFLVVGCRIEHVMPISGKSDETPMTPASKHKSIAESYGKCPRNQIYSHCAMSFVSVA
ncbi:uncharacterized protein SPSK_05701 [Sporothrix schenckii 1099-18]|uniref:Uncharacterized protein n=1 Tax=Sporothrix schenckii 1099-18 TaxID=1397361 RepID=A0A0F2LYJ7_SPOSC|nr:uncharacterized protein SPSK_05701 [Sporothrix schenckii 1099-18]KJR80956.1 hypothetical protein SPSK_05701 [Sporothrix schenckii 1099-18]